MDDSHKTFFEEHGLKSTTQRKLVLDCLHELSGPCCAEEIYFKVSALQPTINLSTIYRILELFYDKGIVIKNNLSDTKKALYELNTHTHKHYMVCLKCKQVFPLENCPCSLIEKAVSENSNFEILDHKIEIIGYCSKCKQ